MEAVKYALLGIFDDSPATPTKPQTAPMTADHVENNAGGYVWKVDDIMRLKRFLCLGSEGGTYYTKERQLTLENAECITRLIQDRKGSTVVDIVKEFSLEGRTAKQTSILFALAVCARSNDLVTKRAAYSALNDICRTPTFLFEFIANCEKMTSSSGWGRAHRKAIASWYNSFADRPMKLAMHVTKYQKRKSWSHVDVLRLSHVVPVNEAVGVVLRYVVRDLQAAKAMYDKPEVEDDSPVRKVLDFLSVVEEAKNCKDEDMMIQFIKQGLVREHVPSNLLSSTAIWKQLLQNMPMTAMIRNLGKMSSIHLLDAGRAEEKIVVQRLMDEKTLKQARIHPFNILVALKTYNSGNGVLGKLTWPVNSVIKTALDEAFYKSFRFVEPTNKRYLLAVDVSGSMCCPIMGMHVITCREAAAAMMMVTRRTENNSTVVGFTNSLTDLNISPKHTLDDVTNITRGLTFGATDCSLPMIWAKRNRLMVDVFIVYTDSETWYGNIHPTEALRQYRKWSGLWNARLIVCAMAGNEFTIADPEDPGMMDVVGFDSAAPEAMNSFISGNI